MIVFLASTPTPHLNDAMSPLHTKTIKEHKNLKGRIRTEFPWVVVARSNSENVWKAWTSCNMAGNSIYGPSSCECKCVVSK